MLGEVSAGILDQRVEVLVPIVVGRTATGAQNTEWQSLGSRWARVTYSKGIRALQQNDLWLPSTISVLMRYTAVVTERCRLRWNDKEYIIASVNGTKREGKLTIVADLVNDGQQGIETTPED